MTVPIMVMNVLQSLFSIIDMTVKGVGIATIISNAVAGGLTFLYLVWPIGWILSIVTTLVFCFQAIKKLNKKYQKELII